MCSGIGFADMPAEPNKSSGHQANIYGVFTGVIDQASVQKCLNTFALATQQPPLDQTKHVHLLMQSTGGFIGDGIALYSFLKNAPLDVTAYNAGSLQSIAAICFLGAKRRIASRHATFMLHRATVSPQLAASEKLESALHSLRIDDARLDEILKSALKFSEAQWANLRNNEFWFTADDALKSGMITEIGEFSPPRGQQLFSFNL